MFRVAVEGNIGSGKSTLLEHLQTCRDSRVIFEPVGRWQNVGGSNLLGLYYQDKARWSFSFQSMVQLSFVELNMALAREVTISRSVIYQERSIYASKNVFAEHSVREGSLLPVEATILDQSFNVFLSSGLVCPLDMIVYLRTPPNVCLQRLKERARAEETEVPLKYITSIHDLYDDWLIKGAFPSHCSRFVVVDGTQNVNVVADTVRSAVRECLPGDPLIKI